PKVLSLGQPVKLSARNGQSGRVQLLRGDLRATLELSKDNGIFGAHAIHWQGIAASFPNQ
ncbi:MAG: hypothetical protein WBV31_19425, partial [Terriglobales bacterium]